MIAIASLAGQVKFRALCVVLSALLLFVLVLSVPSLGQEKFLLTQTGSGFGLDVPQELDARLAGGGTPSTESKTEYLRGQADSRVRTYALRLFTDSLREAGTRQFGENFSLDSALTWSKGTPVQGQVSAVVPLAQGQDHQGNFLSGSFLQPSLNLWTDDLQKSRRDVSVGYVARRRVEGYGTLGGSLFLDRGDYGHQRASLGAEWRSGANFFSTQLHQPLTGVIRTPDGRYEGVLAGWSATVRRSVGARLDLGFEATTWRDGNRSEGKLVAGKTIGQAIALGTTHKATVGYQASPALRLYGGYSRNRLAQGERNSSYELGFEYRLIGERQKLSAAGDEDADKIYNPVRNHPLLAMGVYGLAAFALTDLDEDKKSAPTETEPKTCARGGVSCPQADAVVWIVDAAGQDLAAGAVTRPASSGDADKVIKVRVQLVSVAKPTAYRVSLMGSAVAGTDYDLQSLAVQQGAGASVAQADTEYFRVPAGGETTLEMTFAIKHRANAAISEIGVRLVPVEASSIAATQSIGTLSPDTETGEITAWVRLAGSGTNAGTITPAGTVNPMAGLITIQLLTVGATNVSRSISGNIHRGVFGGAGATAPLRIFVENFGQAPAGGGAKTSNFINFPAQVRAFKAYVRLAHSNGATEDSYTITGAGVRKVAAGVWEVPMVRVASAFQGNFRFTKQTVTTNGQQVVVTVEVPPIEYIKGDGTSERIPTFSSSLFSRVTITLNQ